MLTILLLVFGAISVLLIISGLIVLLVPSKKSHKKNVAPQTLSQALGMSAVDIVPAVEPIAVSAPVSSIPVAPSIPSQAETSSPETPAPTAIITQAETSSTESLSPETPSPAAIIPAKAETSLTENMPLKDAPLTTKTSPEQILQLVTNHERLITLVDGVQKMNNARKDEQVVKAAKDLRPISDSFISKQSWLAVKPYIETIYPNFFKKLNKAASEELADFEIRVCLLLVFNQSSREIAQITNRSVRTIETTVYKIRKKLKISTDDRVQDYLQNL
jgi:DNA-binding CsgD family transcriptional regulator